MITIDTLYAISTPLLGLSSAILTVFTFVDPQIIPTNIGTGTDVSPIMLIISLIGTFLLGFMRITNSVKNAEETLTKILDTQNKILTALSDDSKNQIKILTNQEKLLDIENKNMDLTNKISNSMNRIANNGKTKDTKKSDNSGMSYPINH